MNGTSRQEGFSYLHDAIRRVRGNENFCIHFQGVDELMFPEEQSELALSIVVVVLTGDRQKLFSCLTALSNQLKGLEAEIIVPTDDNSHDLFTIAEINPAIRLINVAGNRTYAELRAIGVKLAKGRIVALTEDHCIPAPNWAKEILRSHRAGHAAIGGTVEKEEPDSALNWAFYLADYLRYMSPIPEGPTNNLTDCNVSYKSESLNAVASAWVEEFHEPEVHAALQSKGKELWLNPEITVYQQRTLNFTAAIRDRYAFGRLFSSTRAANFTGSKRIVFSLLSFLLPVVLVARVASQVFRKRRHFQQFIRSLHWLVLISCVWSVGEFLGYVTGEAATSLTPGSRNAQVSQSSKEALI